jgi:putative peptidoglycan lipid II flippase
MRHIARSTLIIAVFFGVEKVLGFIRNVAIARIFGASPELDAFNAANNIPDMLFALISGGALAMAFIPVLTETLELKGRQAAWDLFSRIGNLVFLVTASLSLGVTLLASQIVRWNIGIVPGFSPEQQTLVANLMRINLIATLFFSLAGLAIAGLQANQHFLLPALAPGMYDLGALIGVVFFVPEKGLQLGAITLPALGLGIHGLVYGTVLGSFMFLAIQLPGLARYRFRWTPKINLKHAGVRQVLRVLVPRVVTMFFIQLVFLAQDNIASRLAVGSITALVYGWMFMQFPESLIGTAMGTALLPTFSEHITRGEKEAFERALNHAYRVILALTIPAAALLIAGIAPLIRILGFDVAGNEMVLWTTRAFMLSITGHSLLEISVRACYAQQDARTPLIFAAVTAFVFIGVAATLARPLGAPGIALANALVFSAEACVFLWLLNRRWPGVLQVGKTLQRAIIAGLGSAALVYGVMQAIQPGELPLISSVLATAAILFMGGLLVLPFIWPEIKLLLKL